MTYVRRIADNGVQCWQPHAFAPAFPIRVPYNGRQFTESFARCHGKKVLAHNTRIVLFIGNVSGGQVQRGQVRGEWVDITAIDTLQQILVGEALVEVVLTVVSADKKAAAAARGVQDFSVSLTD